VLARSAFHHSMNYRSVVVLGEGTDVDNQAEKKRVLQAFVEKVSPGRSLEAREPNAKELKATRLIALAIDEASVKVRVGGPVDDEEDLGRALWAGQVPLALRAGSPLRDGVVDAYVPVVPRHLRVQSTGDDRVALGAHVR
ncbi:MAG: pyridoxamine 5'-phosphate oxidase family protein, partial [Polyangiaceae bacterium]